MKISTNQSNSFADALVEIPESDLDPIATILEGLDFGSEFSDIPTDYPPFSMFKALLLRELYNLSYERLSSSLRRDLAFMGFCGFSVSGPKPDATTLERFRDRVIRLKLWETLLDKLNDGLEKNGLKISGGIAVSDATLVKSARRPRKVCTVGKDDEPGRVEYSDDAEAAWKKKGKKIEYGYGVSIVTDANGLVEAVETYPANESETTGFEERVLSHVAKGRRIVYDKGAASAANSKACRDKGVKDGIMRKKPKGRKYNRWEKLRNRLLSKRRFVVERTFGTLKRTYGMARAKLTGLKKVASEAVGKALAYNLRRAGNRLVSA